MIRVVLPYHLQRLANTGRVVELEVVSPVTQRSILDELEASYPMLRGTVRNRNTGERHPFIRFFACGEDREVLKESRRELLKNPKISK